MTPVDIIPWLTLVLSSVAVLGHVKGWMNSGEKKLTEDLKATREQVSAQGDKLINHDRRIQTVENELKHLPDRDMAHRLELAVEKMSGRLDTMAETLKPIRATTERMNELLVEQAKK